MIIVSGASGKLGRRVVERLIEGGAASRVRALSRDPSKLGDLVAKGVETRRGDFDDPSTLPLAFEGGDVLLLVSTDNIIEPGARVRQHGAAITAAKGAGVPEFLADVVVTYGIATRDGWMGQRSSAVADLIGRPATSALAYFEANRPALLAAPGVV